MTSLRTPLICLGLVIVTVLGIGGYWMYKETEVTNANKRVEAANQAYQTRVAEIEAKKKEPVYITLPGAERIQAPVENYEDATNIWTLVNKSRPLPDGYIPPDLTAPTVRTRLASQQVRGVIIDPLNQMFDAAAKDGHSLVIGSAYRSYATQEQLFASYVAASGYALADKYSAHAGHSEHQTGLAVDISTTSQKCYLEECFTDTSDGEWLAANGYKFGFTLRYPQGKEAITGYNFEPWHYRYVGIPLATALHQSNLTLDEAWPYLETALATLKANRALPAQ